MDNATTEQLNAHFSPKMVAECAPFYPVICILAGDCPPAEYLASVLAAKKFILLHVPLIHWLIVWEMTRDLHRPDFYPPWSKYRALVEAYATILFSNYRIEESSKKRTFGIRTLSVELTKDSMQLHLDGRSVVYENYENRDLDAALLSFLGRIRGLCLNFPALERNVRFNETAERFHECMKGAHTFRMHSGYEKFGKMRLNVCTIAVYLNDTEYFVAVGVDGSYHLCAEAKAMANALDVLDRKRERTVMQSQRAAPTTLIDSKSIDKKYNIAYRTTRTYVAERKFYTLAIAMFTYGSGSRHCVTAVSTVSPDDAHGLLVIEIENMIEALLISKQRLY